MLPNRFPDSGDEPEYNSVDAALWFVIAADAYLAGDATALSLLFGESFEIPIADLLAAEQHRWPLAGPEAYPLVLCSTGGSNVRPLEPWELHLLEASVRTIPDFLEQHPYHQGPAMATYGSVAPANLKLTLTWIDLEDGGCGDDCDHCEH
jgi:glycogen debranching enzyme